MYLSDHSKTLISAEEKVAELRKQRDQLRADLDAIKAILNEETDRAEAEALRWSALAKSNAQAHNRTEDERFNLFLEVKKLRAERAEAERNNLRAVFPKILAALGNGAGCHPDVSVEFITAIPNEVAGVVAQLRAEVEQQCLLNGKGAEREADLLGRLERAEREVERLKADGAASAFITMSCRASRAETDRNNLRADLDAIKAILTEEKARAERAEASLHALRLVCGTTAAELAGADVAVISVNRKFFDTPAYRKALMAFAAVTKTNIENADAYRLMQGRVISAEVELAAERARLDWLMAGGVCMIQHTGGFHVSRLHAPVSRAAIDKAMKEGA